MQQSCGDDHHHVHRSFPNTGTIHTPGMLPTALNAYDATAQDLDAYVAAHDDLLLIFAAGDDGSLAIAGTVQSPAQAKNILSVGSVSNTFVSWSAGAGFFCFFV